MVINYKHYNGIRIACIHRWAAILILIHTQILRHETVMLDNTFYVKKSMAEFIVY